MKLAVAETSFDQHGGRVTSPTASDVITMALSPPLCHSSPAMTTAANGNVGPWSPAVPMTTFRRDSAHRSHVTAGNGGGSGGGGRLSGPRDSDDVSRCQRMQRGAECPTCAATRYCSCCSQHDGLSLIHI